MARRTVPNPRKKERETQGTKPTKPQAARQSEERTKPHSKKSTQQHRHVTGDLCQPNIARNRTRRRNTGELQHVTVQFEACRIRTLTREPHVVVEAPTKPTEGTFSRVPQVTSETQPSITMTVERWTQALLARDVLDGWPGKDSGTMRKENHSHEPAGQRRTTNCEGDLGQVTLQGNAQAEEPHKVKKYSCACPVLGLVPAVPWASRPPVLGLVAQRGVPAHSLLHSWEIAERVPLSCLPASSAGFLSCRRYLVARGSWRLTPFGCSQQSRTLRCGVKTASLAGPSAARRPPGASHLVSMSRTGPLRRPR